MQADFITYTGLNPNFRFVAIRKNRNEFKIIERKDTGYEIVENISHIDDVESENNINVWNEEPLTFLFRISSSSNTLLTRMGSENFTFDTDFSYYSHAFRDGNTFFAS